MRVRDDETLVTDGPFAETKEQLGGYYLIEAETIDEAIQWAARIPSARNGSIEVRPSCCAPQRWPDRRVERRFRDERGRGPRAP